MRKKLDTRFPAARIKKIMQADEEIGKIALAVPVLVSKALELFLQDLCDRTYDITLQRGMKTVSSSHLKQCIHSFNVFDFLKDTVSKVPDVGVSDAGSEDRSAKRRKPTEEDNDSEEEAKRTRTEVATHSSSGRGRGRGRGRGCGSRGARVEKDDVLNDKYEDPPISPPHEDKHSHLKSEAVDDVSIAREYTNITVSNNNTSTAQRNFDLNLELNENEDISSVTDMSTTPVTVMTTITTTSVTAKSEKTNDEIKDDEYPSWEVDKMGIDPVQYALSHQRSDEEEEDYDNEEG